MVQIHRIVSNLNHALRIARCTLGNRSLEMRPSPDLDAAERDSAVLCSAMLGDRFHRMNPPVLATPTVLAAYIARFPSVLQWLVFDGEELLRLAPFRPSPSWLREVLPFFEQYAHSHPVWSEDGTELVNRSGETLRDIIGAVKRVTDVVNEIAASSRDQAARVEEVNRAMATMDEVTQSNAAQTEELSATAGNLSEQAREVQSLVGRFRVQQD